MQLEGLRVIGDPHEFALDYYRAGADELVYMDIVASLYGRNNLSDIIRRAARSGLYSDHGRRWYPFGRRRAAYPEVGSRQGRDQHRRHRAAGAHQRGRAPLRLPGMVLSIEAKQVAPGKWEAYTDNGRERTGLDVVEWVRQGRGNGGRRNPADLG